MASTSADRPSPILPGQPRPQQHSNGISKTTRRPSRAVPDRPTAEQFSQRRSSSISLDGFRESADDMWLPRPRMRRSRSQDSSENGESKWASAPLAFALLPAIGGMVFKNGSAVVSDILLLGLAAIFLNWSVRLPWDWYRSAQELRIQETSAHDGIHAYDSGDISDSGPDEQLHTYPSGSPNYEAPTEGDLKNSTSTPPRPPPQSTHKLRQINAYESSKRELYRHELTALLCCFAFPLLGAYLLHTIRDSLSRPSEGLVSNYNLTIFLLASELRPMSHLLKLVQARTLHLQRIVKDNPYQSVDEQQNQDISGIRARLAEVESRISSAPLQVPGPLPGDPKGKGGGVDDKAVAVIGTSIRKQIQPELDALNRAVRRYEKRAALQAMQTESRLLDLEARLGDAISLAASAARERGGKSVLVLLGEWVGRGVLLPWQVGGVLVQMPFALVLWVLGILGIGGRRVNPERDVRVRVDVGRRKGAVRGGERKGA